MFRNAGRVVFYGLVAVTLVLFCSLMFFGGSGFNNLGDLLEENIFVEDGATVATQSAEMLKFRAPPNYGSAGIVNFGLGRTLVLVANPLYEGDFAKPDIFVMTTPDSTQLQPDQVRRWAETYLRRSLPTGANQAREVGQQNIAIAGQLVPFHIYEGIDEEGVAFRLMISEPFRARMGSGTIVIMGAIPGWDDEAVGGFLNSLQ